MKKIIGVLVCALVLLSGYKILGSAQKESLYNPFITVSPTPSSIQKTQEAISLFMGKKVEGLKFEGESSDPRQAGEITDFYNSKNQEQTFIVEVLSNHVVTYLNVNKDFVPQSNQPTITFQQAEKKARLLAEKNITDFDVLARSAKYTTYNEVTGPGKGYSFSWVYKKLLTERQKNHYKGKIPALYNTVIVIDQYGNLRNFENQFLDSG